MTDCRRATIRPAPPDPMPPRDWPFSYWAGTPNAEDGGNFVCWCIADGRIVSRFMVDRE